MLTKGSFTNIGYNAIVTYLLAAAYLFYVMALQVSSSVMTAEIMRDTHIFADGLGILVAVYFYAYSFMQIPIGLCFDYFSCRKTLTIALLLCTSGVLLFNTSNSLLIMSLGRFLMGLGSVGGFISVLVVAGRYFPAKYYSIFAGFSLTIGGMGAIGGEAPLASMVTHFGWHNTLTMMMVIGTVLALLSYTSIKDVEAQESQDHISTETTNLINHLKVVAANPQNWWIAGYAFCTFSTIPVFTGLWGVPFMQSIYPVSKTVGASMTSMIWLGVATHAFLFGWLSSRYNCNKLIMGIGALSGGIISLIILFYPPHHELTMYILLYLLGNCVAAHNLTFTANKLNNPTSVIGTAIGFNNSAVVAGGAICVPIVSWILQSHWSGEIIHGIPHYLASDFKSALLLIPSLFFLAFIINQFYIRHDIPQT